MKSCATSIPVRCRFTFSAATSSSIPRCGRKLIRALKVFAFLGALAAAACASNAPAPAKKAYSVAEIAVEDAEGYKAYIAAAGPIVEKFGGVYIARGGETAAMEGEAPRGRIVIVEFPSLAAARAFYASAEYQAALPLRLKTATSRVYFVQGYNP